MVGRTFLLYRAGFKDWNLEPAYDQLELGPLQLSTSANLASWPAFVPTVTMIPASLPDRPFGGARFALARPIAPADRPLDGTISLGAVVHPFPAGVDIFTVTATFEAPAGPAGEGDTWAVVVHARAGGVADTATRDTRIAVTLQSAWNAHTLVAFRSVRGARMNTVGGAPPGEPYTMGSGGGEWLPQTVCEWLLSPAEGTTSVFRLELLVDRKAHVGQAWIEARVLPHVGGREYFDGGACSQPHFGVRQ